MKTHTCSIGLGALILVTVACGSDPDATTSSGGTTGDPGPGAGGSGGGATTGTQTTSTGAGGSDECNAGEERCVAGVHESCIGGTFTAAPCPATQGCDAVTGACTDCVCEPGETGACIGGTKIQTCDASCLSWAPVSCDPGELCANDACVDQLCIPGSPHCLDDGTFEVCNAAGDGYDPGGPCGPKEQCLEPRGCAALCDIVALAPSSVGCSFFALNMDNFNEGNPDAVAVGNTSSTQTALVSLHGSPGGVEVLVEGPVAIPPLGQHTFFLPNGPNDVIEANSALRVGGSFRVESDLPVVAYQHSPLTPQATNDASCLLPEATLGDRYVVGSYVDALGSYPSYLNVVATTDNTTLGIISPVTTDAGAGVPALAPGQITTILMNRHDTLQIGVAGGDITGTEIIATAPIAVFGAVECAQVPAGATYCDHVEEQSVPVRSWGQTYVGAHAPYRSGTERFYWRVLAQENGTIVDTTPQQPGFPVTIDKGQFHEWSVDNPNQNAGDSFVITGNRPFAAFQYVTGQDAFGAGTGDPAMITAVPVEQFLSRYVVLTPSGYSQDYIQVIRASADDVLIDGVVVTGFQAVGTYTVADWPVVAGPHVLTSASPFGIVGIGYTGVTSYAYPGGLALKDLSQ